jgi:hypothetical protein
VETEIDATEVGDRLSEQRPQTCAMGRPSKETRHFARKIVVAVLLLVLLAYASAVVNKFRDRYLLIWVPSYVLSPATRGSSKPTDVMFMVADHWEPGTRADIVSTWTEGYPKLFGKLLDSEGRPPQHTFFYPADQVRDEQLESLSRLVTAGYGEIQLQLHHNGDSSETLRAKIQEAKRRFGRFGALRTVDGRYLFGFVHGNWALDNSVSNGAKDRCGVNDELTILLEQGAFADFTFPAYGSAAQPSTLQQIYYASDDPGKPKSYDRGIRMSASKQPPPASLAIVEGPLAIRWGDLRNRFWPMIDHGRIGDDGFPDLSRFKTWLEVGIHVEGRPEWIFIKTHTHGASRRDMGVVLGPSMSSFYRSVLDYSEQNGIRLHFVTAREMYNIAKAAEAGKSGNPGSYRDYVIPPYANLSTGKYR